MKKIIVKNTDELYDAFENVQNGDLIYLQPGKYFSAEKQYILNVTKDITIEGLGNGADKAILQNNAFLIGKGATLYLKNLTVKFDNSTLNTIAMYDNSQLFCNNAVITKQNPNGWNTIFAVDSSVSLVDTIVDTDADNNTCSLDLKNSQLYAENSEIYFYYSNNTKSILKSCVINYSLCLADHSNLYFGDLDIDPLQNTGFSSCYITGKSTMEGDTIAIATDGTSVDSLAGSSFDVTNLLTDQSDIDWYFDDDASIQVDGYQPLS